MSEYDIVIIGTGMGGLVCGNILSRKGYRVCMVEKNKQIGGCLQVYARDKVIFDAGVHYLGGLDKGQNLYQIFKWLGLLEHLTLEKMDEDGFDRIIMNGDDKEYKLAQGYPHFIRSLLADFPEEEKAILAYCEKIKETCSKFPLYNLQRGGSFDDKASAMSISAKNFIGSLTSNRKLQSVLAGNTILYAGHGEETPFHVHALILNSYIESSWKCVDGGHAIGQIMAKNIRNLGGMIKTRSMVKSIEVNSEKAVSVVLADGSKIQADHFISNLHPAKTMELTKTDLIRKIYRSRLHDLKNSVSVFILNIVFKKKSYPYLKHNYYYHEEGHAWDMEDYTESNWPLGYAVYFTASSSTKEFAEGMSVFTYMKYEEMRPWTDSFNTTSVKNDRGHDYSAFKKRKAEKLLDKLEEKFPKLRQTIHTYYTATPLSFRDYIGSDDGSLYGIARDYRDPFKTMIAPRTKLPNLYLTGQNLNLHGILGSAISGLITCAAFLGNDEFIEEIRNA